MGENTLSALSAEASSRKGWQMKLPTQRDTVESKIKENGSLIDDQPQKLFL